MPRPTDMMPASVDVVTVTLQGKFRPVRAPGLKVFAKRQAVGLYNNSAVSVLRRNCGQRKVLACVGLVSQLD